MDEILDLVLGYIFIPTLFALFFGMMIYAITMLWSDVRDWLWPKPTFTLLKDEWVCTESHEETVLTWVLCGKLMMPVTRVVTIADRYERRS